ncbi:MAG TPA: PilT/PilU family type 4a pilus ATPase [Actinomycetota bacterium]
MAAQKPLGEVLIEQRLISREQLSQALARQRDTGKPIGKILLEMGAVNEDSLVEAVAGQLGLPFADLATYPPPTTIATLIPKEVASRFGAVPVELTDGTLTVAMVEPTNKGALREIATVTGYPCRPALGVKRRILAAVEAAHAKPQAPEGDVLAETLGGPPPRPDVSDKDISMHELLERLIEEGGSDLHLTVSTQPTLRLRGELTQLHDYPVLQPAELRKMLYSILTQKQREQLEATLELDMAYSLPGRARFRINVYFQKDAIGAAIRLIPVEIKTLQDLGVPPRVAEFARLTRGLVLVTGPTGSGKSTTLAGVVDIANSERPDHILTVEDPIEFVHNHKRSLVNQREVGADTKGFANALRSALRQDPDIILVGEMRDLETISTALTAAETGHLVFATLHTQSAPEAIDRVIDVFPPHQQQQVRVQLAATVQGVVTQQLVKTKDGVGRALACEVMVATPAIRNLIREGKTHMIYSSMQAGGAHGMQTMDQSLGELVRTGKVAYELALERCHDVEDFNRLAGKA